MSLIFLMVNLNNSLMHEVNALIWQY